jgi:hypothetical protein
LALLSTALSTARASSASIRLVYSWHQSGISKSSSSCGGNQSSLTSSTTTTAKVIIKLVNNGYKTYQGQQQPEGGNYIILSFSLKTFKICSKLTTWLTATWKQQII